MDWPARLKIQSGGESYIKLFVPDAIESLKILREHCQSSLENQIILRDGGEDGKDIVCCKSYLLRISGYFRSFVERWNNDEADSVPEIKLENIPLDVIKNLLELAATGLLEMRGHSDLSTLVGAANFLEMTDLNDRFSKLIQKEIKNGNTSVILWCYMIPEEYHGYVGLSGKVSGLVKANFEYMLATCCEQLMDLSGKQWLDLVSDPELFVVSEDVLFRTICRWVAIDLLERSADFLALAKHIRGGCLSKNVLAEFRNASSIPAVVRLYIACINDSFEPKPRTVEVVGFFPCEEFGDFRAGKLLCHDPFARSEGAVSSAIVLNAAIFLTRARCVSPSKVVCLFEGYVKIRLRRLGNPIHKEWIPRVAHGIPYTYIQVPGSVESTYLDGFLYLARFNRDTREHDYYKVDCTDKICSDVSKMRDVPDHLRNHDPTLIGLAGKIHIFTRKARGTYDPRNEVWSVGLHITPPFEEYPRSCCIGPDGMIYINLDGKTKLWIFNVATSEFRVSAACTEPIQKILNVDNKIVCLVSTKEYASWVYDHENDLWTSRQKIPFAWWMKFRAVPIRLLASSSEGDVLPRNIIKRQRPFREEEDEEEEEEEEDDEEEEEEEDGEEEAEEEPEEEDDEEEEEEEEDEEIS